MLEQLISFVFPNAVVNLEQKHGLGVVLMAEKTLDLTRIKHEHKFGLWLTFEILSDVQKSSSFYFRKGAQTD